MWIWVIFSIYTIVSATGLLLIKVGADNTRFAIQGGLLDVQVSPKLLLGFLLYASSFLLSIYVISKVQLFLFYPIATGTILIFTALFGYYFLDEQIGIPQIVGMVLILIGVVTMNINI
jgi:multidrug transporter EmrE-like cation transporter